MSCVPYESLGIWRLIYGVFFITCGLITTILNVISLAVLCQRAMRSRKSNYFLTSLVVSDVIMGTGMCPFVGIVCLMFPIDYCSIFESMILAGFCLLYGSSVSSLVAIAYDRYLLIDPPTYHSRMTRCKSRIIIAVSWSSPVVTLSFLAISHQTYLFIISFFIVLLTLAMIVCYRLIMKRISKVELHQSIDQRSLRSHNQVSIVENDKDDHNQRTYPRPLVRDAIVENDDDGQHQRTYSQLPVRNAIENPVENDDDDVRNVMRNNDINANDNNNADISTQAQTRQHQRNVNIVKSRKLAHRLFILIAAFCICMLPTFLAIMVSMGWQLYQYGQLSLDFDFFEGDNLSMKHFRIWSEIGGALNSLLNPFIYTFTSAKFKAELRKMFPFLAIRTNNKVAVK